MRIVSIAVMAGIPICFSCSGFLDVAPRDVPSPDAVALRNPARVYPTGFTASWTAATSEHFSSYHVYCSDKPNPDEKSVFVWKTVLKNDTTLFLRNLNPATRWFARVRVYNGFACSESNEISVVTPDCSCGTFTGQHTGSMALIPGGCYTDVGGHEATISHDYLMDTTEVTESEWYRILKPDSIVASAKPKVEISWFQILMFCNRKSKTESRDTCYSYSKIVLTNDSAIDSIEGLRCDFLKNGYRLPTEDEWEYAYRCGTTTDFFWGKNCKTKPSSDIIYPVTVPDSNEIDLYAWWARNAVPKGPRDVGLTRPNAWHLRDMCGNIAELVWDIFGARSQSRRLDYAGPSSPSSPYNERVLRGGMFSSQPEDFSADARTSFSADGYTGYVGFRTVCTVP